LIDEGREGEGEGEGEKGSSVTTTLRGPYNELNIGPI